MERRAFVGLLATPAAWRWFPGVRKPRRASPRYRLPPGSEVRCEGRSLRKVVYADEAANIVVHYDTLAECPASGGVIRHPRFMRCVHRGRVEILLPEEVR